MPISPRSAKVKRRTALLAWVPLMKGGDDAKILARWREVASAAPDAETRGAARLAELFAEAAGCGELWEEGLRGWDVFQTETVKRWTAQAREDGEREGERIGQREGKADALRRVIDRRFGAVPPEVEQKVKSAEVGQLDAWLDLALSAATLEELRAGM